MNARFQNETWKTGTTFFFCLNYIDSLFFFYVVVMKWNTTVLIQPFAGQIIQNTGKQLYRMGFDYIQRIQKRKKNV